ncbi:MAG: GAF domain-containing protein [Chloroflexi bacterium]|nr:GAF domain-containing protein [Chloroflexota bacterium]
MNSPSGPANKSVKSFQRRLWDRFVAPSPEIQQPDQRRQAALLTGFLLGTIVVAVAAELVTLSFADWENYQGWRVTLVMVVVLGLLYRLSRTRHTRPTAMASIVLMSAAVFAAGLAEPRGILGGLMDFLILPLWLGSLYLTLSQLAVLVLLDLAALLALPWLAPDVALDYVLVGPVTFLLGTSILLFVITIHRDRLEQDRQAELIRKEAESQREAARAHALLRVAERLNAQMDLETLFEVICEEITQALDTPASTLALYEPGMERMVTVAGVGLPAAALQLFPRYPLDVYKSAIGQLGDVFAAADIPATVGSIDMQVYRDLNCRSIAVATICYNDEIIGYVNAISLAERREFSGDELLLLRGIADQAALALINTRLYKDARRRLENLQALRAIDIAITANHDLADMLAVALEQITNRLDVDAAAILIFNRASQRFEFAAGRGFSTQTLKFTGLKLGEGMAGRAAQERRILHVPDLVNDPKSLIQAPALQKEGFVSYFAAPLIVADEVRGVLEVFHRTLLDPEREWLDFLEALSGQTAIAIENSSLFDDLLRSHAELFEAYDSTIEGWSHALDLRDRETEGHTRRVTELTLKLARAMGLEGGALVHIRRGALLHDIGKMGIPDDILLKEGPLTDEEWVIMRRHPVFAFEMLNSIRYLRPALEIPYAHHEKWDGSGYPFGLEGEQIPFSARIFSVVDVWDALTSDRPYRQALSRADALAHIEGQAGKHFDPQVVERFLPLVREANELSATSQAGM